MNRRNFFRTMFGTLAALPIARLFGGVTLPPVATLELSWSDMMGEAMEKSLTDWHSGYVEVERSPEVSSVMTTSGPQGSLPAISTAPFDRLGVNSMYTGIAQDDGQILWSVVDVMPGLTWTELDTAD